MFLSGNRSPKLPYKHKRSEESTSQFKSLQQRLPTDETSYWYGHSKQSDRLCSMLAKAFKELKNIIQQMLITFQELTGISHFSVNILNKQKIILTVLCFSALLFLSSSVASSSLSLIILHKPFDDGRTLQNRKLIVPACVI